MQTIRDTPWYACHRYMPQHPDCPTPGCARPRLAAQAQRTQSTRVYLAPPVPQMPSARCQMHPPVSNPALPVLSWCVLLSAIVTVHLGSSLRSIPLCFVSYLSTLPFFRFSFVLISKTRCFRTTAGSASLKEPSSLLRSSPLHLCSILYT